MRLKVGNEVRIKDNVKECEFGCNSFMENYVGKIAVIEDIYNDNGIKLDVDGRTWVWSENILELVEEDENIDIIIEMHNEEVDNSLIALDWALKNDFIGEHKRIEKEDVVNHPSHYNDGKIEVMDYIEDKQLNFARGNVIKYVSRAGKKDRNKEIEDLKKASWYLNREIERLNKEAE